MVVSRGAAVKQSINSKKKDDDDLRSHNSPIPEKSAGFAGLLRGATGFSSLGSRGSSSSFVHAHRPGDKHDHKEATSKKGSRFFTSGTRSSLPQGENADLPPEGDGPVLQRSVFKWIQHHDDLHKVHHHSKKTKATITAYEMATTYGIPQDRLARHLTQQIEEADSCTSLPFTLLMVAAYTVMVILHDPAVSVYSVEESITFDIEEQADFAWTSDNIGHKAIYDIDTFADVFSWFSEGLVPLMFMQEMQISEGRDPSDEDVEPFFWTTPQDERGVVLNYNRLVGGIRVRQERGTPGPCTTKGANLGFYGIDCRHGLGYELWPETWTAFTTTNGERDFWLWVHEEQTTLLDRVYQKEAEDWLDAATRKIEIAIPIMNLEYNIYSLIFVSLFFSRGGHIWKRIIPMSTYSSWWHGPANIVVDSIWGTCMLWITFSEGLKIRSIYNTSGWRGVRHDYLNFWIIIDWISVGIAIFLTSMFMLRLNATASLNDIVTEIGAIDYVDYEDLYRAKCMEFLNALDAEVHRTYEFRIFLGVYPLVIIMRLFKAFSAQPRLSMVTRTLSGAAVDLLHFLLVFSSIFLTYAVAGILLFGREADGFTTLPRAIVSCFRFMMGEFDWEDISVVGRGEAGLWFVTFCVISTLLMLNMLLAMVMDSYSKQKEKIGMADTLIEEAFQVYRRWLGQRRKEQLHMREILKSLYDHYTKLEQGNRSDEPSRLSSFFSVSSRHNNQRRGSWERYSDPSLHSVGRQSDSPVPVNLHSPTRDSFGSQNGSILDPMEQLVTVDKLMAISPGLRRRQASEIVMAAIVGYFEENKEEVKLDDMLKMLLKVEYTTKKLKEKVDRDVEQASREIGLERGKTVPQMSAQVSSAELAAAAAAAEAEASHGLEFTRMASDGSGDDEEGENSKALSEIEELRQRAVAAEPTFMEVLDSCRLELRDAKEWVGQDWVHVSEASLALPTGGKRPAPLSNLDDVPEYGLIKVIDSELDVLEACRIAGISSQNDDLRRKLLGRVGRCVLKDHEDKTVKCDFPGYGTAWFGIRAVTRAPPPPSVRRAQEMAKVMEGRAKEQQEKGSRSTVTLLSKGTLKSSLTSLRSVTTMKLPEAQSPTGQGARPDPLASLDPARMMVELENELQVGQHTLREATNALAELREREEREQQEKENVSRRFRQLKKQVVELAQEHMELQEEVRSREASLGEAKTSKDEYMALVHTMIDENQRLKARLAASRRSRPPSEAPSRATSEGLSEEPEPMPDSPRPHIGPGIKRFGTEDGSIATDRSPGPGGRGGQAARARGPPARGGNYLGELEEVSVTISPRSPLSPWRNDDHNQRLRPPLRPGLARDPSFDFSDSDIDTDAIAGSLRKMREHNLYRHEYVRPASERSFNSEADPRQRRFSTTNRRLERNYARAERMSQRSSDRRLSFTGW